MAYFDIGALTADHVVSWLRGLHDSLQDTPLAQIIRNRINGNKLVLMSPQDVLDLIPSLIVEALQAIMAGIKLIRYFAHNSNPETLQSITLNLACQARYLYNQLIQAELSPRLLPVSAASATPMSGNSKCKFDFAKVDSNMQINQSAKQRVSLETLDCVTIIVDQILHIVNWLDSANLTSKFNKDFKSIVVRVAIELTSTAQRDQFVEQPNDVIKKTSKFLADYCEWVVMAIDDPDFIQPCCFDIVSIKKKLDEDNYGILVQPVLSLGHLVIEEVIFSGPSHRSGCLKRGDEIVQVDYQLIAGWPPENVMKLIGKYNNEVILTIKKKPCQTSLNPALSVMRPFPIPFKKCSSHTSESITREADSLNRQGSIDIQEDLICDEDEGLIGEIMLEPPKEPKGPVYELQPPKPRPELRRRVSISGSISDALVDLSLGDSLPIPTVDQEQPTSDTSLKAQKITKETLTKSVSHDTAKLYLHTLSIDRKHLWQPNSLRD